MLKKFFLNALSSFVGAWVAMVLFIIAGILFLFGSLASVMKNENVSIGKGSVLVVNLSGIIDETETTPKIDYVTLVRGNLTRPRSLSTIVNAIDMAASNSNIEAILIDCNYASAGLATMEAIRNAIVDFKKSGKKVIAYADNLIMSDYLVASVADEVYLNPVGSLALQGISGTSLYFKDFLDKIGVSFDIVRVGTYKSAVEPFIQNEMSEAARAQLDTLYTNMWNLIREDIAKYRKVPAARIDSLVNNYLFLDDATVAKNNKLIDGCLYKRQLDQKFADYTGRKASDINYVSCEALARQSTWGTGYGDRNQIAVIYAVGDIAEFEGAGINCDKLVPIIVNLAEDDKVKGLVLRVNSPGGSAFGSEQIGEALEYFKSKNKKLAVSMGDYAASGGYWISAGADRIFAEPLTITGSIGIFGMVPNIQGLTEKIGIHPQTVSTNPEADFPKIFKPMTEGQKAALQKDVERGYTQFIERVAKGRKKSVQDVESIASGRVWDAVTAKNIGLVDELGGLQDAISWVADASQMGDNYVVSLYPRLEMNLFNLLPGQVMQNAYLSGLIDKMKEEKAEEVAINSAVWLLLQSNVQARALSLYFNF